jgi:hypothetical protein
MLKYSKTESGGLERNFNVDFVTFRNLTNPSSSQFLYTAGALPSFLGWWRPSGRILPALLCHLSSSNDDGLAGLVY